MLRKLVLLVVFLGLLGGGSLMAWSWLQGNQQGPVYRTERVTRGALVAKIAATGTIEPEEVIDVGAQVAGQIKSFGRDPNHEGRFIDYGSEVNEKTVLAQLDDSLYRAEYAQALATVKKSEADLRQAQVKAQNADRIYRRNKELRLTRSVSELEYDQSEADARAAEAAIGISDGTLAEARASLQRAETNLGYTVIRSPVKGVIIDRRVNVGQTVVASLNAPSLFLIAKDLARLQVWASVNEADIGNIKVGQTVTFAVDTYPNDLFKGEVAQIRYNATMTQNVVTYTVVVNTDNHGPDGKPGKLIPYLTANLQFRFAEHPDALLVPNAALRYRPPAPRVHPDHRAAYEQAVRRKAAASGEEPKPTTLEKPEHNRATVWVEDDGFLRPIKIRTGLTDGAFTEVLGVAEGEDLPVETSLVIGEEQGKRAGNSTVNPFAPGRMFGGKKKEGG